MRFTLLALTIVAAVAVPASARPDDCATETASTVATYDPESVTDYPAFMVRQATRLVDCLS